MEMNRRGLLCSLASAMAAVKVPATRAAIGPMKHDTGFMASLRGRTVDPKVNGFDPHAVLRDFDRGRTRRLPGGRMLREFEIEAGDQELELAPGVRFAAWSYNGRVPGPTLRATEGDLL